MGRKEPSSRCGGSAGTGAYCRRFLGAAAGSAIIASSLAAAPARAQAYPSRAVRIIAPFAAGGSSDITARIIGQHFSGRTGQPFVVENLPGASGTVGMQAAKRAAPDGHTLVLATTSTLAANQSLFKRLPYDPAADFSVVGLIAYGGMFLLVRPDAPYRTLDGFVAHARANPDKVLTGWFNATSRVPAALLARLGGLTLAEVPYRQVGQAMTDLVAGRLQAAFIDTVAGEQYLQNGDLHALGITTPERIARYPDVPAFRERFPEFDVTGFFALAVPAATPADTQQRLNALVRDALGTPEIRQRLEELGMVVEPMDLEASRAHVRRTREMWAEFIRIAGIEPE